MQAIRAAQNLRKIGVQPREMFAFIANRCDEFSPIVLAAVCLACPVIPLVTTFSNQEIVDRLKETKPSVIFCDADAYHKCIKCILNELNWEIKVFTFGGRIDDTAPVANLLLETGNEHDFV